MGDIGLYAKILVDMLKDKSYKITTAESCTGGMVASNIVSVAGASDVFREGYVTYSDEVKEKVLGVKKELLEKYTAVSSQVAKDMALGALSIADAELAVSITGYAGPDDAEDGTPAGTVYIGVCLKGNTFVRKYKFEGDREEVRSQAAQHAFMFAVEILEND